MKQTFKNHFKHWVVLFGIFLMLINCQKDDLVSSEQRQNINQSGFKITKIGKSNINSNKKLKNQLTKLSFNLKKNKSNSQNKSVVSTEHGFTIDTDYATYIENADATYHSYTFYIQREVETDSLQNLLLSLKPDGFYKILLITYNTTAQEKEDILNGISVDLSGIVSSTEITDEGLIANIFSKALYQCEGYVVLEWCSYGNQNHPGGYDSNGNACPGYTYDREYFGCGVSGGGGNGDGGNTGGTGTGGTGSGGGGSSSGDDDVTTPTGPCKNDCPEEFEEDCNTTKEALMEVFPNASQDDMELLAEMINDHGTDFGINTAAELQHFLAQAGHESNGFASLGVTENLNYSATRLTQVWPSRFSFTNPNLLNPNDYANNPVALGNYVYCCRNGNGDIASGDGYLYRGRGIFQLTGRSNYEAYEAFLNDNGLGWTYDGPESLELDLHAIVSALWFFKENVLDEIDISDNTHANSVTNKVNYYTDKESKNARQSQLNIMKNEIDCL